MERCRFIVLAFNLLIVSVGYAQTKGHVYDRNSKAPIAGVQIVLGEQHIAISDQQGAFTLNLPDGESKLSFKHLGYQDSSLVVGKSQQHINVYLSPSQTTIEEVYVYTGYEQAHKERATGSFSVVKQEQIEQLVGRNITTSLPLFANGLMGNHRGPTGSMPMVRGLSTIRADKKPLIVLDNFPYDGHIDDIPVLDIANVTVLKDAAASAIWGVRAGNGVIVITTKKGKLNQKTSFRLSTAYRLGDLPEFDRLQIMSSTDFIGLEEFLFEKGYYNTRLNSNLQYPISPIVNALQAVKLNEMSQTDYASFKKRLAGIDSRQSYLDAFYSKSLYQQHHLQGSGGSEKTAWMSSLSYDRDMSVTKSRNDRLNYRMNNEFKLHNKLRLLTDISVNHQQTKAGKPAYGDIKLSTYQLPPYTEFKDTAGNPIAIAQHNPRYIEQVNAEDLLLDWSYYPLIDYKQVDNVQNKLTLNLHTGINYKVMDFLNIDLKYNLLWSRAERNNHRLEDSYFSRNLINLYSVVDRQEGTVRYNVPKGGVLDQSLTKQLAHNARLQANIKQAWDKHEVNALLGFEGRMWQSRNSGARLYGVNADNLSFGQVDYANQYPDVITGALKLIDNNQQLSQTENRFVSAFANAVYSYDKRLNLSGSLRRDATNLFGLRTNDKWNMLWSVGASWKVLDNKPDRLNDLKLRTTYGFAGNIDPSMTAVNIMKYSNLINQYTKTPVAAFTNYANPDLRWERIGTLNIGADMALWQQRLKLNVDWYLKKGKDLFGTDEVDITAGIGGTVIRNVASMSAQGWDIGVDLQALKKRTWGVDLQLNISHNRDHVDDYQLANDLGRTFVNEGIIAGIKGKPVYSQFSYPWKGLDTDGNPIGYFAGEESKNYGQIYNSTLLADMIYNGPVMPRWFGAGGARLYYANLSLDFRLLYKFGHSIRTESIDYSGLFSNNFTHADYAQRWQQPGDEQHTQIPVMVYPLNSNRENYYKKAAIHAESGSHIRLQFISLNYELAKLNNKLHASIFANAENLGVIWKKTKKALDPEYENTYNALRPAKQWTMGCRLQF